MDGGGEAPHTWKRGANNILSCCIHSLFIIIFFPSNFKSDHGKVNLLLFHLLNPREIGLPHPPEKSFFFFRGWVPTSSKNASSSSKRGVLARASVRVSFSGCFGHGWSTSLTLPIYVEIRREKSSGINEEKS